MDAEKRIQRSEWTLTLPRDSVPIRDQHCITLCQDLRLSSLLGIALLEAVDQADQTGINGFASRRAIDEIEQPLNRGAMVCHELADLTEATRNQQAQAAFQ